MRYSHKKFIQKHFPDAQVTSRPELNRPGDYSVHVEIRLEGLVKDWVITGLCIKASGKTLASASKKAWRNCLRNKILFKQYLEEVGYYPF